MVGKQEMVSAIDAVCDVAQRIIGKLKDGAAAGGVHRLVRAAGDGAKVISANACDEAFCRQPRTAEERIKPPAGYKMSISICRAFLNQHAPKKADGETTGKVRIELASAAQLLYAKKIAQGKGIVIPDEAKADWAAMSAWIDFNRGARRRKRSRKTANKRASRRS